MTLPDDNTSDDGENFLSSLTREDLACLGMRRADDPWDDFFRDLRREETLAQLPKTKRPRKPRNPRPATIINQIENDTGKTVTGVTIAAGGDVTLAFGGDAAADLSTADDELERWRRRKDAR